MNKFRVGSLPFGTRFVTPLTRRRGRVLEVGMLPEGGVPVVFGDGRARDLHPNVVVEVEAEDQ